MANHRPDRTPGQRFRFEQYLPYLRANGVACDVSFLLGARDEEVFYGSGDLVGKARLAARALGRRRAETTRARLAPYDVAFVHRGALFFGPPWIERRIARSAAKLVFDLDDALWIRAVSEGNRRLGWLKFARKVPEIMRLADVVVAGNGYIADFARRQGARRVETIPTTIDTAKYEPRARAPDPARPVCIGWTGSRTTVVHFEGALPALRALRARFGDRVRFELIGDERYELPELGIRGLPWKSETEVEDLRELDVGIMPLPDDEWSRGKCALKALQYMALGIATVASPVGVNAQLVRPGENGLLAGSTQEWVEALSRLVEDADLRRRVGEAGRATVVRGFSTERWRDRYLSLLRSLARP
jgi:glycosyltransferase involved in cell wall biosynthesis